LESSNGGLSGSLVERLSGKPVELGLALPKGWGSWQGGDLAEPGMGILVGHGSSHPMWSWGPAGPEVQGSQGTGILVECGSGLYLAPMA
jgi:hypothetical protein